MLLWAGVATAQQSGDESATAEPATAEPQAEKEKFTRKNTFGIGPGFAFWPPQNDDPTDVTDVSPGLALQFRRAGKIAGVFGFEWANDIVFHDWKGMGDAYNWYFGNAEDDTAAALRLVLWPGLILIPFGGANYSTGFGLVIWTSESLPAVYFDIGANLNLWLRLSDPDFRADFGLGAFGGIGFDLFENFGANLRVLWGVPAIHTLIRQTSSGITQVVLNINFFH